MTEQDFLEDHVDDGVCIFLTNGVKLQGRITGFDEHVVFITRDDVTQMVYKQSMSTILPNGGNSYEYQRS